MRSNEIKELTDVEHVKARPGMYIGSCEMEKFNRWIYEDGKIVKREVEFIPALLKMFDEVISNSIDEAIRTEFKFANQIQVNLTESVISVQDNGRGVPTDPAPGSTISQAVIAFTRLRAGGNFNNEKVVSIGTHGLGASLVNILSDGFVVVTDDGKKHLVINCYDGLKEYSCDVSASKKKLGTKVTFSPEAKRFGDKCFVGDIQKMITKRMFDLSACFPKIKFSLNGEVVKAKKFQEYVSLIGENAVIYDTEDTKVAVLTSEDPEHISFVNGIDTYAGGSHVNYVREQIVTELTDRLRKMHKKLDLSPSDVRNKICLVLIANAIKDPKFPSQTKESLSNSNADLAESLSSIGSNPKFIKDLLKNEHIILPIIETKKLRLEAAENVAAKKAQKNLTKIKVPKHIPSNGPWYSSSLFLTEGDSATGPFAKVRDPSKHGCFPLRGKPLSTWGMKPKDILENKEMSQLMGILGLNFDSKPTDELNYKFIKIMADADYDGYSIVTLLVAFFMNWPWLFEQKRVSIVRCPIIVAKKAKAVEYFYRLDVFSQAMESGKIDKSWSISYKKGLGSLNEEEYLEMVTNPVEDVIEMDEKAKEMLEVAFGADTNKRKEWLSTEED